MRSCGTRECRKAGWLLGLLPLLLAVVSAALHPRAAQWSLPVAGPGEVTVPELVTLEGSLVWVDARSADAYGKAHIPGAISLNEDNFEEQLPILLEHWFPGSVVLVYCDSRVCDASHALAERLRAEVGLPDVRVLFGGWNEWQSNQGG
jgi:3-mercaptopyruvate sulfurtransferase SseA